MVDLFIPRVFLKTAYYWSRTFRKTEIEIIPLKQQWAQMVLSSMGFKIHIFGKPPQQGPIILVGNHISYMDIPLALAVAPEARFIAKREVSRWPIVGGAATTVGTIFVERESGKDRSAVRRAVAKALNDHNATIIVFPSGTTTLDEQIAWKKGIFEIAKDLGIPIKLFKIDYQPLRETAYIDDDQLLLQMSKLRKYKNKVAHFTWLEQTDFIENPAETAEQLRRQVARQS